MNHKEYFDKAKNGILSESPSLSSFLKHYYDDVYDGLDEDAYRAKLCKSLSERDLDLPDMLKWFCCNGYGDFDGEEKDLSLEDAIMEADVPMVEFLISHGANPLSNNCEMSNNNFYMENLDVQLFDLKGEAHFDAITKAARVLAKNGVTYGSYLNIEIDSANHTIRLNTPKYKY